MPFFLARVSCITFESRPPMKTMSFPVTDSKVNRQQKMTEMGREWSGDGTEVGREWQGSSRLLVRTMNWEGSREAVLSLVDFRILKEL